MNDARTNASSCAEAVPVRYDLIDKDGRVHGPYASRSEAVREAEWKWPDEKQDEDSTGNGWDIRAEGCR